MEEIHTMTMDDGTEVEVTYYGDGVSAKVTQREEIVDTAGEGLHVREDWTALYGMYDSNFRVETESLFHALEYYAENDEATRVVFGDAAIVDYSTDDENDDKIAIEFANGDRRRYTRVDRLLRAVVEVLDE